MTHDSAYDRAVAVTSTGDGGWDTDLSAAWRVGAGINGGYLLAVVGNALRQTFAGKPDPVAVSAHFLSAGVPGPARVEVDVRREGGSFATASADLVQDGKVRLAVLATYGDLSRMPDNVDTTAAEPDLPPIGECPASSEAPPEALELAPMLSEFDVRYHPRHGSWASPPSGAGVVSGWFRLPGREPDTLSLLTVLDALPPVTFDLGIVGWAPTLELTAHVRARPAPGWLRVVHRTRNRAGGMFEEDCEVWDSAGRLVAQSRQLALEPRARM